VTNFYSTAALTPPSAVRLRGLAYQAAGHEFSIIVPGSAPSVTWTDYGTLVTVPARGRSISRGFVPIARAISRTLERLVPDQLEVADRLSARQLGRWAKSNKVPSLLIVDESDAVWAAERSLDDFDRLVLTTGQARAGASDSEEPARHTAQALTEPAERVVQIPVGVNLETFSPLRHNSPLHDSSGADVVVVCAAPLTAAGSVSLAVDVIRKRFEAGDAVHLVVLGDGPLRARLETSALGLPVQFLSARDLTLRERAEVFATADISLVTQTGPDRLAGTLESLASGTPVIRLTTTGNVNDRFDFVDGGGLNVSRDVSHIAHAFAVLEAESVEKRRRAARSTAVPFDSMPHDRRMLDVHETLAKLAVDQ